MDQNEFKRRTKAFALSAMTLKEALPRSRSADVIARQLIRSASSVGANYRACCRARSPQEMVAKLGIVEEEADECMYWLELLEESRLATAVAVAPLLAEAGEILAMTVASKKTLRTRIAAPSRQSPIVNRQSLAVNRES